MQKWRKKPHWACTRKKCKINSASSALPGVIACYQRSNITKRFFRLHYSASPFLAKCEFGAFSCVEDIEISNIDDD